MKHNNKILKHPLLKNHDLGIQVCKFLESKQVFPITDEEVLDILDAGELCGYFNAKIDTLEDFIIQKESDSVSTKGLLLFQNAKTTSSYDQITELSSYVCKYQGGLDLVIGAVKNDELKDNEYKIIFVAVK